jgi:methionyl-tRNA formyltransferase
MRVVLFSATEFGYSCLKSVLESEEVVGIITIPREFNISYSRGKKVYNAYYYDFKAWGAEMGIPVLETEGSFTASGYAGIIKKWRPDLIIAAGWYFNIPAGIRGIPSKGCLGFHASLLPKYRGGAPIPWAIINGEDKTGVTLFHLSDEIDAGDIVSQKQVPIFPEDKVFDVIKKAELAAVDMLKEVLPLLRAGMAPKIKQVLKESRIFPQRSPEDGLIDWNESTTCVYNFIRAQSYPYPGAFTFFRGKKLIAWSSKVYKCSNFDSSCPGTILAAVDEDRGRGFTVRTKDSDLCLLLTDVQCGDVSVGALEFFREKGISNGEVFSNE